MGKRRRGKLQCALKHRFQERIFTIRRVGFYFGIGAGDRRQFMVRNRNAKVVVDRVDHIAIICHMQVDACAACL